MPLEIDEQAAFLAEYNEWRGLRKTVANDTSPEAFLVDRAKEGGLEMLDQIQTILESYKDGNYDLPVEALADIAKVIDSDI